MAQEVQTNAGVEDSSVISLSSAVLTSETIRDSDEDLGDYNEDLVDYEMSPDRENMEINTIYFSDDYQFLGDDEQVAQFDFAPKNAVFKKPTESDNHLRALYLKGHINGKPISRMLVDGGAIVNLMPYSLYKKLGGVDSELIKTHMKINGVGGCEPLSAKGVASMELTIGSKTMATAFFVTEVQGNFSLILGHDWIHANQCIPSTLHQCLIQWINDEVETVYGDTSACVAIAASSAIGAHDNMRCLTSIDLSDSEYISCNKNGFVATNLKLISDSARSQGED